MSDSGALVPFSGALISRLASGAPIALPYQRDIFLLHCDIAGTYYRLDGPLTPMPAPGDEWRLIREPANPFDDLAIRVEIANGRHIGYIPRGDNPILARLLDAGKHLFARFFAVSPDDPLRLTIEVFLRES